MDRDARPLQLEASISEGPGLAHDAGNLLGALQLYCDLLALPGVLREEHRHYAEELRYLSGRSTALIDRLLNPGLPGSPAELRVPAPELERGSAARNTSAAVQPIERLVLPEVIEHTLNLLHMIARRDVRVAFEDGSQTPVAISLEALERILVNLTKNAAEASPSGAAITLRVSCPDAQESPARIVLRVEDHGCGMSAAAVKLLLEGPVAERTGTRSLGLRVVRELVAATGGEFTLRSRIGRGTTVEVTWPAASEVAPRRLRAGTMVRGGVQAIKRESGKGELPVKSEPSKPMDTRQMLRAVRQGTTKGIEGGLQC